VGDVWIPEGDTGTTTARVPITLSTPAATDVSVTWTTPWRTGPATIPAGASPGGDMATTARRQDAPWRPRRLKIARPPARIAKGGMPAWSDILRG
jgi:hypothetical protein